jgi:hypothetical protein
MGNSENLATYGTQDRKTKQKHNTICIGHHYAQANTNNVNKIWALPQTTEGIDFFIRKS